MDIEKLIEQLNGYFEGEKLRRGAALDAATALSTLQAENGKLRAELKSKVDLVFQQAKELDRRHLLLQEQEAELEQVKRERDAAIRDLEMVSVCDTCVHEHAPSCPGCNDAENWEWRGPEEGRAWRD